MFSRNLSSADRKSITKAGTQKTPKGHFITKGDIHYEKNLSYSYHNIQPFFRLTPGFIGISGNLVIEAAAHPGRTDANGGHRDNKNKSGLGSYHYHCGSHPAHLHPNGVCLMEAVLPLVSPDLQVVLPPKISLLPKPRPHQKPQHRKFLPAGSMTTMAGGIVLPKILITPAEQLISTVPPIYLTVMDICLPAGSS